MSDKKARILLIDDDVDFLAQQRIRFEAAGYEVHAAEGPDKGRAMILEVDPDLVLVDLMMGQMDAGIVLAHEFKKARPERPVILVTGVTRETGLVFDVAGPDEKAWLKVDKVLAKPVRFEQLRREVEMLLARKRQAKS
ncbi:MAG: response regulator [Elusimicrobiota bacterium]|jgi:DNA-binding response OmpR family regulator